MHIFVKEKKYLNIFVCVCFDASLQDVDASEIKVQVCVYAFDLLYLNGEVRSATGEATVTQRSLSALPSSVRTGVCVRVYCLRARPRARRPAEMPTASLNANDGATGGRN